MRVLTTLLLLVSFLFPGYIVVSPAAPVNTTAPVVEIHPLSEDNILREDGRYVIRDNGSGREYILDGDTVLDPAGEGDLPGYEDGDGAMAWMERYVSLPMEEGGFGMGDIMHAVVTGNHIDRLCGVYWWD